MLMPERVLLDNDVVLKMASYRLGSELIIATTDDEVPPSILVVATHVVRSLIDRSKKLLDKGAAKAELEAILDKVQQLEPTQEEIVLAADFEQAADELALEFDGGESLLFAILLKRKARRIVTGDKRAIRALEQISTADGHGCIACFEQLIATIAASAGHSGLRTNICAEPDTDKAMTVCFSCGQATAKPSNIDDGLSSYINSIRQTAPNVLASGGVLFAVIS
jgi:hypothetical protein